MERISTLKINIEHLNQTIKNWQNLNNGSDEFNERLTEIEALKLDKDLMQQRKEVLMRQIQETNDSIKNKKEKSEFYIKSIEEKNENLTIYKEKLNQQEKNRNKEITTIEQLKKEKNSIVKDKN